MDATKYKIVMMPIEVPIGDFCWQGQTPCEHFDNEGGHGSCMLGMYVENDRMTHFTTKSKQCKGFKDA